VITYSASVSEAARSTRLSFIANRIEPGPSARVFRLDGYDLLEGAFGRRAQCKRAAHSGGKQTKCVGKPEYLLSLLACRVLAACLPSACLPRQWLACRRLAFLFRSSLPRPHGLPARGLLAMKWLACPRLAFILSSLIRHLDTKSPSVFRVQPLPAFKLHCLATSDAADGSSAEQVIQNIKRNVPSGSTH
jgi:hypothetical protein